MVALLAATALTIPPAAAHASPLLDDVDATELAQSLAEATAAQGICYGWRVEVADDSGGTSGIDAGSGAGPNRPVADPSVARALQQRESGGSIAPDCRRTVELTGDVLYTCESCEAEDSSRITVTSSFPDGPTEGDLEDLELRVDDMHADDGDEVLASLVGALPLVAASNGSAPAVPGEVNRQPIPAADEAQDTPATPDWLRDSWLALTCLLVLMAGGAAWLVAEIHKQRIAGRSERPDEREGARPPSGPSPTTEPE